MAKSGDVFQQIQERLESDLDEVVDDEERDRQEKKHYLFKMYQQLERYLKELPVEVINSGKYDVNAMKVYFFAELARGSNIPWRGTTTWCARTTSLEDQVSCFIGTMREMWRPSVPQTTRSRRLQEDHWIRCQRPLPLEHTTGDANGTFCTPEEWEPVPDVMRGWWLNGGMGSPTERIPCQTSWQPQRESDRTSAPSSVWLRQRDKHRIRIPGMLLVWTWLSSEPRQTSDGWERPDDGTTVPDNPGKDTVHPGQWLSSEADVGMWLGTSEESSEGLCERHAETLWWAVEDGRGDHLTSSDGRPDAWCLGSRHGSSWPLERDVFKNTHVSKDDIGDHMKTYAEEQGIMNQKRKCMIGSIYGEKIMVISTLLKWYELVSPERHSIACSLR